MDRRQLKTRRAIFEAFNALLSRKRYDDVTVQEIIDEANVGRSTFYAHFETKDALLREMCDGLFSHVVADHATAEATHDFSGDADAVSAITHILYHLKDPRSNITGLLRGESSGVFLPLFKQFLRQLFAGLLGGRLKPSGVPEDMLLNHISCSFVELIYWWIQNGLRQTPEELEGYFALLMNGLVADGVLSNG